MIVNLPMVIVLVTGVSGSGKSTLARQLRAMGRDAISADADTELAGWHHIPTGVRVPNPESADTDWLAAHQWRWNPDRLDAIIADARARGVDVLFMCGNASNGVAVADRFDVCLLLEIDRATMAQRLRNPSRGNPYGKDAASLEHALAAYDEFVAAWRRYGAVTVDATPPVAAVAEDVLMTAASALLRPPRLTP